MSQTPTTTAARPDKIMSSRLMSMKFMQRAAASTAQTQTPVSNFSSSSNNSNNKRQKTDLWAVKVAVNAEEAKIEEALDRHVAATETKWVLSSSSSTTPPQSGGDDCLNNNGEGRRNENLRVLVTGHSDIDNDGSNENVLGDQWVPSEMGRRSFGRFNRELEKRQNAASGHSSPSDSKLSGAESEEEEEEEEEEDDDDGEESTNDLIRGAKSEARQMLRAERMAQKKDEKPHASLLEERRKNKEVKLNKLSSISGGGGWGGGEKGLGGKSRAGKVDGPCFRCGDYGHMAKDCNNNQTWKRKGNHGAGAGGGGVVAGGGGGFAKRSKIG